MKTCLLILIFSFSLKAQEQIPYTVFLKEGSLLTNLKDHSEVKLSKGIYAKVFELNPKRRDVFNVYDKKGIPQYLVSAQYVEEIAEDINLLPTINPEKVYPPKTIFRAENKFALFDSQLNIHLETLGVADLNSIYNDRNTTASATRYEIRTLYVSELPVEFGFNLNYQSAYWKNDEGDVKLSILSLGPQFKYPFWSGESYKINALFSGELAPVYEGSTALYKDKYSAMLYDFGIESDWNSSLGIFSFGSHFRHHEIALTQSTRPNLETTPKEFSLNSLGLMVGYKIEWDL